MSASSSLVRAVAVALPLALATLGAGCDLGIRLSGSPPGAAGPARPVRVAKVAAPAASADDPLGPQPTLAEPATFAPKPPVVFQSATGITVWLVERETLPLVTATFVVPYGSSSDPEGRPGVVHLVADMLDEGAGKRSALEVSDTVSTLGATLTTYATPDGSFAGVSSLKVHFDSAFDVLCDVVARPRLEAKDFTRVKKLWKNLLLKRSTDPEGVASVVSMRTLYGEKNPYGHPVTGLLSSSDSIDLAMVKSIHGRTWRPERATLVVVGQVTRKEIEEALAKRLGEWKPAGEPLGPPVFAPVTASRPRVVLSDRPGAVQTVMVIGRDGTSASDSAAPVLDLVNSALGGSFTSRLNLNLREEKHWTYGIGSTFTATRGPGTFYVRTSVETPFTGRALKEILGELTKMADAGLDDAEIGKVKALDRAELIETYETVSGTAGRLATLVAAGLPPGFDAAASQLRQAAGKDEIRRLAREHVAPGPVTVVLVGDRKQVEAQLAEVGLDPPVLVGPEGQPIAASAKPAAPR